jgi:hypothetical protein
VPSIKAALHRGRARLRELATAVPDEQPTPILAEPERSRLALYVERVNARDFDAIRNMLADDVRLDLMARSQSNGDAGRRNSHGKAIVAHTTTAIEAPITDVWDALVNPGTVKQYMFGTDVISDWKEGSSIVWRGEWQGKPYEDAPPQEHASPRRADVRR